MDPLLRQEIEKFKHEIKLEIKQDTLEHIQTLQSRIEELEFANRQKDEVAEILRAKIRMDQQMETTSNTITSAAMRQLLTKVSDQCETVMQRKQTAKEVKDTYRFVVERQQHNVEQFIGAFKSFNRVGMLRKWRNIVNSRPRVERARIFRQQKSLPRRVYDPTTGKFRHLQMNEAGGEFYPLSGETLSHRNVRIHAHTRAHPHTSTFAHSRAYTLTRSATHTLTRS